MTFFFEADEDGWVLRQIELCGPYKTPTVAAIGGNAAWVFQRDSECSGRSEDVSEWNTAVVVWLDVRYLQGEMQFVFTPRIERHRCDFLGLH